MSTHPTASAQIIEEVTSWPGVEAVRGARGELSLRVGGREIGHLHGDHAAHRRPPAPARGGLSQAGTP